MTHPLGFDELQALWPRWLAHWPDHRQQGPHTSYAIPDAALGAFGVFFGTFQNRAKVVDSIPGEISAMAGCRHTLALQQSVQEG